MTNPTPPDHGAMLDPEVLALAPVGGKRRPVKVVEHPALRTARRRAALEAPFTVLRLPVVSLNAMRPVTRYGCAPTFSAVEAA